MKIEEQQEGDVTILILSGQMINVKIDIHPYIKNLIEQGKKKIIVDIGKIKWFSSTGLGALMASYTSLNSVNGDLKIARPSRKIYSLIYQMKLREVFATYDTVQEAIDAFATDTKTAE